MSVVKTKITADLHMHSTASDGQFLPSILVQMCRDKGLNLISLTDHDSVDGVEEAVRCGNLLDIKVLPGIELSSFEKDEIHILGYNIAFDDKDFLQELKKLRVLRAQRQKEIIAKLNNLGIEVSIADAKVFSEEGVLGRTHIAKAMIAKGYCHNICEAFDKYLGRGQIAYVEEHRMTPPQAVEMVNRFGGVAVLAHPCRIPIEETKMDALVKRLKDAGLAGIESEYFSQTNADKERFRQYAARFGLICTGGSDFHDLSTNCFLGKYFTPDDEALRVLGIG